jgi:hypothetical protein
LYAMLKKPKAITNRIIYEMSLFFMFSIHFKVEFDYPSDALVLKCYES